MTLINYSKDDLDLRLLNTFTYILLKLPIMSIEAMFYYFDVFNGIHYIIFTSLQLNKQYSNELAQC